MVDKNRFSFETADDTLPVPEPAVTASSTLTAPSGPGPLRATGLRDPTDHPVEYHSENPYQQLRHPGAPQSSSGFAGAPGHYGPPPPDIEASHTSVQGDSTINDTTESVRSKSSISRLLHRVGTLGRTPSISTKSSTKEKATDTDSGELTDGEGLPVTEDPHHILDTILEEDSDDDSKMIGVEDAIHEMDPALTGSDTASEMKRRQGYRENLQRHRRIRKATYASKIVHFTRRIYDDVLSRTLLTRCLVWWFPLALILFVPLACGAWQNPSMRLGRTRVMWIFIWLEVVWASLFIGRVIAHYIPEMLGFIVAIVAPRYFKIVDVVMALETASTLVIWTFVSFITFVPVLSDNHNALNKDSVKEMPRWQRIVNDILVALLVSALVYFVEQVFIHLLSTNFHRTRMAVRIKENKKAASVLIVLLDLSYSFFPYGCDEFLEEDRTLAATNRVGAQAKKKLGSNIKMKKFNKVVGDAYRVVGQAAHIVSAGNIAGPDVDPSARPPVGKTVKDSLATSSGSQALADRIWKSLVMEDSDSLQYEDLLSALGPQRKDEVLYMFDILDLDGEGGIGLEEMREAVVGIGKEGRKISKSLVDVNGAIQKLHHVLLCFLVVLVVIIFVGMLAPSAATVLATLGSTLLALSFMFSTTCAEVFSSCVFLFVKHPFDVGDWVQVFVSGPGLVRMQVTEMSLLYCVFTEGSANIVRQVSNSVLNTVFIDNLSRSGPSAVAINLTLGLPDTTMADIRELERRVNAFLEENERLYIPGSWIQVTDMTDVDRLTLTISVTTRNSRHDITAFSDRRTILLEYVMRCVNDIPLHLPRRDDATHNDPALPMYTVTLPEKKVTGKRTNVGMVPPGPEESADELEQKLEPGHNHDDALSVQSTETEKFEKFEKLVKAENAKAAENIESAENAENAAAPDSRQTLHGSSNLARAHSRAYSTASRQSSIASHGYRRRYQRRYPDKSSSDQAPHAITAAQADAAREAASK